MGFFTLLISILVGCASSTKATKSNYSKASKSRVVETAQSLIGTSYKYGGLNPREGFDCSGLTTYVFGANKTKLPHSSKAQAKFGKIVERSKWEKGDLLFFKNKDQVNHVALISKIEGDQVFIIHSTSSKGVILEDLNQSAYWTKRLYVGKRIIEE